MFAFMSAIFHQNSWPHKRYHSIVAKNPMQSSWLRWCWLLTWVQQQLNPCLFLTWVSNFWFVLLES